MKMPLDNSYNPRKTFYFLIALVGIILMVFEIHIYRKTIIKTTIPISIIFTVGLIAFFFDRKNYNKTYSISGFFFPLGQNIISWGFITCYLFMATNYYLSDKNTTVYNFTIKGKSSLAGSRGNRSHTKPVVTVDYFGFDKELVFTYPDTKKIEEADSVTIKIRKGFFGFDVLNEYDVIEK